MLEITSINTKKAKEFKYNKLTNAFLDKDEGIIGDYHKGSRKGQIFIFSQVSREKLNKSGLIGLCTNKFYENITLDDIDINEIKEGDNFIIGEAKIKILSIGKNCYEECPIISISDRCIIKKEVISAMILESGQVSIGDKLIKLLDGRRQENGNS